MAKDWVEIYRRNADGFLYCSDFIQAHPDIPAEAKKAVIQTIVSDLMQPSIVGGLMSARERQAGRSP